MRSRIAGRSSLPSSKRKACTMCRFSGSDWLFQKSVAWLKWSKNFSPRSRTFGPSSVCGCETKPPIARPACIGQPPPTVFGW